MQQRCRAVGLYLCTLDSLSLSSRIFSSLLSLPSPSSPLLPPLSERRRGLGAFFFVFFFLFFSFLFPVRF
jgi:hypothetical protein